MPKQSNKQKTLSQSHHKSALWSVGSSGKQIFWLSKAFLFRPCFCCSPKTLVKQFYRKAALFWEAWGGVFLFGFGGGFVALLCQFLFHNLPPMKLSQETWSLQDVCLTKQLRQLMVFKTDLLFLSIFFFPSFMFKILSGKTSSTETLHFTSYTLPVYFSTLSEMSFSLYLVFILSNM